jgi:kynureninase
MYAMETQAQLHGFNPDDAVIEIGPRKGEHSIRMEDIEATIKKHKKNLAVVIFGGVNYYTGQFFDMEKIVELTHEAGAICGFDLAHAVGNKVMHLHDWKVDFACWCSYKYLNSGPGAVGGIFVHEKHVKSKDTFRLAGWWGHDEKTRFKMKKGFKPTKTAESWQMSNAQVLNMAAHRASLDIFDEVGMDKLAEKSLALTAYAEMLLLSLKNLKFEIITPSNPLERGCQLSLLFKSKGREVFEKLQSKGVIADWREPNVIRIAPVPMYNSFEDVYTLYEVMKTV